MPFNLRVRPMRGKEPKMGRTVHAQGEDVWATRCGIQFSDADPTSDAVTCKNCLRNMKEDNDG